MVQVQKTYAQLFAKNLIDPQEFLDFIVECICPNFEAAKGVGSVLGKIKSPPHLDTTFPYDLTSDDRNTLERLLPNLPELHGNMSESEISIFLGKYRLLQDRPSWEPLLVTQASRDWRANEQAYKREEHRVALRHAVSSGQVKVVQGNHLPAKHLAIDVFIPNIEARKYLEQLGIASGSTHSIEAHGAAEKHPPHLEVAGPCVELQENSETSSIDTPGKGEKNTGTPKRWTDEKLKELQDYRKGHTAKETADHFGITTARIRQLLPQNPKAGKSERIWAQLG